METNLPWKGTLLAFASLLGGAFGLKAQSIAETRYIQRYDLLQPYVPEKFLLDRSPLSLLRSSTGLNPDRYTANRQDSADVTDWEQYYRLFFFGAYHPVPAMRLHPNHLSGYADSVRYQGQWNLPTYQRVPLMDVQLRVMNLVYREIQDSAMDHGYMVYDSLSDRLRLALSPQIIRDTLWFPPGSNPPYLALDTVLQADTARILNGWSKAMRFVQAVADRDVLYGTRAQQTLRLMIPQAFWVSNDSLSSLWLDTDDGNGWRRVYPNQLVQWSYASFGPKTLRLRWRNAGGQNIGDAITWLPLHWVELKMGNPDRILVSGTPVCNPNRSQPPGRAVAYVKRSRHTPFGLLQPLILVEGFEGGSWVNGFPESVPGDQNGYGDLNWASMSTGFFPARYAQLGELPHLLDSLDREGMDLVFVDYETNHASVEKNALALISILEQVKRITDSTRAAIPSTPYQSTMHVLGASMGGLIARVALRQMELNGCCHGVASFGTLSTPHGGANIPLSVQNALLDAVQRGNLLGRMETQRQQLQYVLRSPAAAQMLTYHVDAPLEQQHLALKRLLDSLGLPRDTRNYAITNGSLTGQRQGRHAHAPFDTIRDGEPAFALESAVWAPHSFPLPFRSFRDIGSQRMVMFRNQGRVVVHSPRVPAYDTVYLAGNDIQSNFSDIQKQYALYLQGLGALALNRTIHSLAAALFPMLAPWIAASKHSAILLISHRYRVRIESAWNAHHQRNRLGVFSVRNTVPRLGLDYAPGDYSTMGMQVSNRFVESVEWVSIHSFVSTVSALNLDTSVFRSVLSLNIPFDPRSFERWLHRPHWSETHANDPHAMVYRTWSGILRNWLRSSMVPMRRITNVTASDTVHLGWHVLSTPLVPFNSLVRIPSLVLENGSVLRILAGGNLMVHDVPSLPDLPTNADREIRTLSVACDSVTVDAGSRSLVELGRPLGYRGWEKSCARFGSGSRLVLRSGSRLWIRNGYRLLMDSGSVLEMYPGSVVDLEGDSSLLEIHGQVILHPGTVFRPRGGGRLWVQANGGRSSRWTVYPGASLEMRGRHRDHERLRISGHWSLDEPRMSILLDSCRVRWMPGAQWSCAGPVTVRQCRLGQERVGSRGGVWTVNGTGDLSMEECELTFMQCALRRLYASSQRRIRLVGVRFAGNDTGLVTHHSAVDLIHCRFENNRIGWKAFDLLQMNRAFGSAWLGNGVGLDLMGQGGARIRLQECRLDSNTNALMSFGVMRVEALCNEWTRNQTAWYAGNTQVWLGDGAMNFFGDNGRALHIEEADLLYLRNGNNTFSGNGTALSGMLSGLALQYLLPQAGGLYGLETQGNRMPYHHPPSLSSLLDWDGNPLVILRGVSPSSSALCMTRQATGGGSSYFRESQIPFLTPWYLDSLTSMMNGLNRGALDLNDPLPAQRQALLQTWNATCALMESTCHRWNPYSIPRDAWYGWSLEIMEWCAQGGGGSEPAVLAARTRLKQWKDRCGSTPVGRWVSSAPPEASPEESLDRSIRGLGPNPWHRGQYLVWNPTKPDEEDMVLTWHPLVLGRDGQSSLRMHLRPGANPGPDLAPGIYRVGIQRAGRTTVWVRWVVGP